MDLTNLETREAAILTEENTITGGIEASEAHAITTAVLAAAERGILTTESCDL